MLLSKLLMNLDSLYKLLIHLQQPLTVCAFLNTGALVLIIIANLFKV